MQNRRNSIYVLTILSLLTGLFTGRAFFFNLAYVFGGLLFVSFAWAWLSVRWIRVGRKTRTRRAQVGRYLEESFQLNNAGLLPKLWVEVRDHSNLPGHRASHVVPALNARASFSWQASTLCTVRGEFTLGPMTLISGDPFGLFVFPRRLEATSRIIVYPSALPIDKFNLPTSSVSGGEARRRRTHYVTTNASGVRDYAYGDSFNRIDWKGSARRDRLVVKEFELDPMVDIWLFVDFSAISLIEAPHLRRVGNRGSIMNTTQGIPPSTEEYAVVVAASLAKHFIDQERALGFAAYTPEREVHQPERGNRQLTRIFETLAVARSFSEHSLREMLTLETPYFTRGTTLIIVTASTDTDWISSAQVLSRRGIKPMCILIDASSFGNGKQSDEVRATLEMARIPTISIQQGDDISRTLAQTTLYRR